MNVSSRSTRGVLLATVALLTGIATPARAQSQPEQVIEFNLPATSLDEALKAIGRQSGREIMYPQSRLQGKMAPALSARLTADDAIRLLLRDTDLQAEFRPDVVIIRGRDLPSDTEASPTAASDVIVTGTRIRGAASASPQISVSRETMRRQGFTDLGSFARSLPQNFSGGQNPGIVGGGAQGGNENATSSSTLNLRGLGSDATLTLINGHRVAFDAVSQGIDISAIPLLAVERVEVVTDGASAIYGSDAVGGVANVILRRRFDGVLTTARVGTTTRGGNTQYQLDSVTGADWGLGGLMAALSYLHATEVTARQRSFASTINGSAILSPSQEQISGVLNGDHRLADGVVLAVDASFNHRVSHLGTPFTVADAVSISGNATRSRIGSFAVAPTLSVDLGRWTLTGSGSYSESDTQLRSRVAFGGVELQRSTVDYDNRLLAGEMGAEGPLFPLPGGEARASVGAGHRSNRLSLRQRALAGGVSSVVQAFNRSQDVTFAYGEVFAPIVGEANAGPFVQRLELSGAVRYERIAGSDGLATPKLGLVYAPVRALTLKGSWGRSFKAPTLYQRYLIRNGGFLQASIFGQSPSAPTDAVAFFSGGNPDLAAEKATTWSATTQLAPLIDDRLLIEASYYHITFSNRVVLPVTTFSDILTNPANRPLLILNPSAAQIAAAAATLPLGFTNQTGLPTSSLNLVALVDITLQNASAQNIQGIDLSARDDVLRDTDDTLQVAASASYLELKQRLTAAAPQIELTDRLFYPSHWRARASVDWDGRAFGASAVLAYTGSTLDRRSTPFVRSDPFVTLDLVARLRSRARGGLAAGLEGFLSVVNVFDRAPATVPSNDPSNPPYDSTNYSALGRVVSLTLAKRW